MAATRTQRGRVPLRASVGAALLAALCGCGPLLPLLPGPDLDAADTVTILEPALDVGGLHGLAETEFGATTVVARYRTPSGDLVYEVSRLLSGSDRERLEQAVEDYLVWERTLSARDRTPCTDLPSVTVTVEGSLDHESSVQDCEDGTPLEALVRVSDDLQDDLRDDLATPAATWTVGLFSSEEEYELAPGWGSDGMLLTAHGAPAGWGEGLPPGGGGDGEVELGEQQTLAVLRALNTLQREGDQIECVTADGQLEVVRESRPSGTWSYPVCDGRSSEALLELLRGL